MVFRNTGTGTFEDVTRRSGDASVPHSSRGAAFGDIDNDGDIDVLVMNMNERPSLLRNDYAGGHGWLTLQLEGTSANRSAIGAIATVTAGGITQARTVTSQASYYSHDDFRLHFGLGARDRADAVVIRWPDGRTQTLGDVPGDRILRIKEP
jgi:hypothetical protein